MTTKEDSIYIIPFKVKLNGYVYANINIQMNIFLEGYIKTLT
jgi:hypothetical protein